MSGQDESGTGGRDPASLRRLAVPSARGGRVAGYTRTFMHGAPPDWALELVPPPSH